MKKTKCFPFFHTFEFFKLGMFEGVLYKVEECTKCPKRRVKRAY